MNAIFLQDFGSADQFETVLLDIPSVGPQDVLVQMKATAFNPIDYQMRLGMSESKFLHSAVLGRELAGVVADVGREVVGFRPGDAVAAYVANMASSGTYTEFVSVPQQLLAKVPPSLSWQQAASLPLVGLTSLQCFERLSLTPADFVFISGGAGGVGTVLIQLLLSAGVKNLVTTAGNEESSAHLRSLGLAGHQIVSYRDDDLPDQLKRLSPGGFFDCCIDLVGGCLSETAADLLKIHGKYADVACLATGQAKDILFDKAATIFNIANYTYTLSGKPGQMEVYSRKLSALFEKIETGDLLPIPVEVIGGLSAETVKTAHRMMEENRTHGRKLVMINEPDPHKAACLLAAARG